MLTTNQPEIDLGTLKFGKAYNFVYKLTNISSTNANIDRLVIGCQACTTATIDKKIIPPGTSAEISATFTPGSTGINVKNLSVLYNVNNNPLTLMLKFKANVIA